MVNWSSVRCLCAWVMLVALNSGCGEEGPQAPGAPPIAEASGVQGEALAEYRDPARPPRASGFVDSLPQTGIAWSHRGIRAEIENRFNLYDHGSGVAVADFDGDGAEDIYLLTQVGHNALLRNTGSNRFEDVAAKAGVTMPGRVCVAAAFGDYDNDGFPDLYVATTRGGNLLFHNEKNGTFQEVTKKAGLDYTGHSACVSWLDHDNDSFLDLFVGNTGKYTTETFDQASRSFLGTGLDIIGWTSLPRERALLYRNNGNGTFTEIAQKAGVAGKGWVSDATACDYDGDGHVDLYVSRMFGDNFLYRNRGNGTFEDVTAKTLARTSIGAMGARWADVDNDTLPDLYVVDMHSDMWANQTLPSIDETRRYEGPFGPLAMPPEELKKLLAAYENPSGVFGNTFFRNTGAGGFEEMAGKAGLENFWPWSIAADDFDGDGHVDFFVGSGMGYPWDYWPNTLLMNTGSLRFVNRARELGVEPRPGGETYGPPIKDRKSTRSSRAAATADFDSDGRVDIIVNNFNHEPSFLHNEFPPASWLEVKLTGKKTNRDAVGAVVVVKSGNARFARFVDGGGGYLSQSSRVLHFGLGNLKDVDEIEVRWPGKRVQRVPRPRINTRVGIEES